VSLKTGFGAQRCFNQQIRNDHDVILMVYDPKLDTLMAMNEGL